jgi:transcriptional regulator CtsR
MLWPAPYTKFSKETVYTLDSIWSELGGMGYINIIKFKYNKVYEGSLSSLNQYISVNNNHYNTSHIMV